MDKKTAKLFESAGLKQYPHLTIGPSATTTTEFKKSFNVSLKDLLLMFDCQSLSEIDPTIDEALVDYSQEGKPVLQVNYGQDGELALSLSFFFSMPHKERIE